jgi:hypothetical protein
MPNTTEPMTTDDRKPRSIPELNIEGNSDVVPSKYKLADSNAIVGAYGSRACFIELLELLSPEQGDSIPPKSSTY